MAASVVIPALNEAPRIGTTIDAAFAAGAAEVIVADGGSSDATVDVAHVHGAIIVTGERVRARQLNRGAERATHETLVFVHADTQLPHGGIEAIEHALASGAIFGGFRITFEEPQLRTVATLINARTRLTRAPWGDQAHFLRRETFARLGGYRDDMPIMEDYELARRMKREGRVAILPMAVRTSGRRFVQKGVLRTSLLNWTIIAAYHCGVRADTLARWYRAV